MSTGHNEVREFRAELLSECCKGVSTEPVLQKPAGETLTQSAIQSINNNNNNNNNNDNNNN